MDDSFEDPQLRAIQAELAAPFPNDIVHWRVGSTNRDKTKGLALAYIDARHVMDRLDEVCGVGEWQAIYDDAGNGKTTCRIGIKMNGEWVWKSNGAGDTDVEGDKGAFSDAFKRAAVLWGIGRYLYGIKSPWVPIEPMGRSFKISDDGLKECRALLDRVPAGDSSPSERKMMAFVKEVIRNFCAPEEVDDFIEKNRGMLSTLSKANKQEVWELLQAVKENANGKV